MDNFDTVFFGPFIGELGWELSRWQGFCRFWSETKFKDKKIIVASFPGRHPFYKDFAHQFINLPDWFLDCGYDVDSYESVSLPPSDYGKLLNSFKNFYNPLSTKEIRTPRGCTFILPVTSQQKIISLTSSSEAAAKRESLIGNNPYIVISARGRKRASFRNWPEEYWEDLCRGILDSYPSLSIVLVGAPSGSVLRRTEGSRILNLIFTPKEESIDLSIAFLQKAQCSITSQSGTTHLSLQTRCPSVILGHEQRRHAVDENYLRTPVMFLESKNYNVHPSFVLKSFINFYEEIQKKPESQEVVSKK